MNTNSETVARPSAAPLRFTLPLPSRIMLLLCVGLIGLVITSVVSYVLTRNGLTAPRLRVATVIQDIMVFVLPALVTAMLVTRRPAELLCVDLFPRNLLTWILPLAALLCSIPAMNWLVMWNEGLTLPDSLGAVENWMRESEANAGGMISLLTGGTSAGSLIITILIVGVFAGFSEEILFRGGLQRLLTTGGVNPHLAIWLTAFLFSAIHLQFFGFFPRLLLGGFFGYLLLWTRSLWVPIVVHAVNNTIVVVSMWSEKAATEAGSAVAGAERVSIDSFGADSPLLISLSLAATTAVIALIRFRCVGGR